MSEEDDKKIEKIMRDRLEKEFEEKYIEETANDIQIQELERLEGEGLNEQEQREEERLMELYKLETGKNPITARKTLRKEYIKWKSEGLQEEQEEILKEEKEIKKTSNLKSWLSGE